MTRFSTVDLNPPAAIISFSTAQGYFVTNAPSSTSLFEGQIRSVFEGAQREVRRYERYTPRWDGYQAEPFPQMVLERVATILDLSKEAFLDASMLPALVTTGPASDGSIDVELQVADRRIIMTLYADEEHVRLLSFDAGEADEHLEPLRTKTLEKWFTWLHRSPDISHHVDPNPIHP